MCVNIYKAKITEYGDLNAKPKFFWNYFHKRGILSFHKEKKYFKIQFMYFFNDLWKYYLKKDEASGPHRKMVSVPGNQLSSTKNYLFILNLEKNNFKLIFCNTTPVATLIQTFRNSPGPHHSAGLRNADV